MAEEHPGKYEFQPTRWSLVSRLKDASDPVAEDALAELCRAYWYPLYAFVRRSGKSPHEAEDLTQGFFLRLLEKETLLAADRRRGKLRSFLLTAMNNFLTNEWKKDAAMKRGGGTAPISIDAEEAEGRYLLASVEQQSPERMFDRQWALTVLDRVLGLLGEAYAERGKQALFETLKQALSPGEAGLDYAALAEELGMREGALKVAVHRLRGRYRELLLREIADTLESPTEEDAKLELAYLVEVLG